jgi:hypothetical protein
MIPGSKLLLPPLRRGVRRGRTLASRARSRLGLPNPKVFCIGRNKTGTTSLGAALRSLGYRVGDQRPAELLMEDWGRRDFRRLIRYCHTADAFQDVPFSHDYTFQALDAAFPGSRFILSVRGSTDEWYASRVRFDTKRLGAAGRVTVEDLRNDPYVYKGWSWRNRELVYGADALASMEDEQIPKQHYERHNWRVQDYFRHRPSDLLVVNVADEDAMQRICEFLGKPWSGQAMPVLNKSA